MIRKSSVLLAVFCLALLGVAGWADEGTPAPTPVAPAEPKPPVAPDEKPAEPTEAPVDAPKEAAAPETPRAAFDRIVVEVQEAGPAGRGVGKERATTALSGMEPRAKEFRGEDAVYYARLLRMADRTEEALETVRGVLGSAEQTDDVLDQARVGLVETIALLLRSGKIPPESAAEALDEAEKAVEAIQTEKHRLAGGGLRFTVGGIAASRGDHDRALRHYVVGGMEQPGLAPRALHSIVARLMEQAEETVALPAARTAAAAFQTVFRHTVEGALAKAKSEGKKDRIDALERALKGIDSATLPLRLMESEVPEWTTVHSFRGGASPKDYRGKVVLVDFWATWCPWCIKSFPAMRDLLKEYGEKGFAIVGVTTSSPNVWDARYDLDDDLKSKATEGAPVPATLRLARDADDVAKAEHKTKERDVIASFVANHEIPWDVVMIEGEEPSAKYGLTGWPYGVLVDRKGRIRHLHAGAILRDNAENMAQVRKRIEALLAEPE